MWITVKGYHRLRRYTAGLGAGGRVAVEEGSFVAAILKRLEIPVSLQDEILLYVNGRPSRPEQVLRPGDNLVLLEKVTGG
jgi:hypothetical protein